MKSIQELADKLQSQINESPMNYVGRKLEVECQCNQVSHNRNPMFSHIQGKPDWMSQEDWKFETYQANAN